MKAISLWQPWASAIAFNSKRIETRPWRTHYRGPLAIHAAKRCVKYELIHLSSCWNWQGALHPVLLNKFKNLSLWESLPFGAIVAVCILMDCRPTGSFTQHELDDLRLPEGESEHLYSWTERQMGNFGLDRWGWILSDIKQVDPPIPFKGQQGLFNVPDELLKGYL
jgi:activating signal cointegrator 1